jgi:hypothetical protein
VYCLCVAAGEALNVPAGLKRATKRSRGGCRFALNVGLAPQSRKAPAHVASLQKRLENIDLREYLVSNYLILHGMDGGAGAVSRSMSVICLRFVATCSSRLTSRGSGIRGGADAE